MGADLYALTRGPHRPAAECSNCHLVTRGREARTTNDPGAQEKVRVIALCPVRPAVGGRDRGLLRP